MSEDKAEAWVRKKPKRIIQNQTLIVTLAILLGYASILCPVLLLWSISVFPSTVQVIVIAWGIGCIGYCVTWVYAKIRYPI